MCTPRRGLKGDKKKEAGTINAEGRNLVFELCSRWISSQSKSALKHHDLTDTHSSGVSMCRADRR